MRTSLDLDRNGIHDSLQTAIGDVYVGLSFEEKVTQEDVETLESRGYSIRLIVPSVNAILIGKVSVDDIWNLAELENQIARQRSQKEDIPELQSLENVTQPTSIDR